MDTGTGTSRGTPPAGSLAPLRPFGWLLAVLSAGAVLWATHPWGVGIDGDSVGYIRTARSLAAGHGWAAASPLYPPLFPLLLAPFPLFGVDPNVGGRYLEAGLLAAILLAAWHWMLARLETRTAALAGMLALATATALVEAAGLLLTEVPFILAMTLALVSADRYWRDGAVRALLAFAVFCALASSLRYVGVTLVATGAILILARPGISLPGRLRRTVWFGAVSASLTLVWLAYNKLAKGSFLGGRKPAWESPDVALGRTWDVIRLWVWPPTLADPLFGIAAAGLVVALAAAVAVLVLTRRAPAHPAGTGHRPVVFAVFLPLYLAFIVLVKLRIGTMEARYLTPVVIPLFLLAAYGFDRCLLRCRGLGRPRKPLVLAMGIGAGVWLLGYSLPGAALTARFQHDNGYIGYHCYNARRWQATDAVGLLKQGLLDGTVVSNNPRLVYFYSRISGGTLPTTSELENPERRRAFRRGITRALADTGPVYLLYLRNPFTTNVEGFPAPPEQLGELVTLAPRWVGRDQSGAVFEVTGVRP
jgi:hypothetical protein